MKNKSVAIVALGNSCAEYMMAKIRSEKFDETWAINSVSSVIFHDKMFMMDPPSRFLDTPNAEVLKKTGYAYLNNTVAYAIAYAIAKEVKELHLYGIDFTHKNVAFAEAGRACCEFWLAIATTKGIKINIAYNSSLLDTNVPDQEKLYGYHRLDNPLVSTVSEGHLVIKRKSKLEPPEPLDSQPNLIGREDIPGVSYEEKKNV